MTETKNTLGIILLIVGVLIGAGGGYLYVQNKSNPIIAELSTEETTLLEEIQASETIFASLTSELETIQDEIVNLDYLIIDTQAQLDSNIDQIQALDEDIFLETGKITQLKNQTALLLNYERFNVYNLMFQTPIGMKLLFVKVEDKPFSKENGGIVADLSIGARDENLEFFWETFEFEADASVDIETHVNDYVEYLSESEFNFQTSIGDKKTMDINGHTAYLRTVYIEYRGEEIGRATFCMWFCNESELMFRSFYVALSYKSSIEDRYGTFWQNTYCH